MWGNDIMRGVRAIVAVMVTAPFLVLAGCGGPTGTPANSGGASAISQPRAGSLQAIPAHEDRNYSRGLSLDGRLWLRGDGSLASLTLPGGVRKTHFADSVIDLAVSDGKPVVLRSLSLNPIDMDETLRPAGGRFVLSSWTGNGFKDSPPFELPQMPRALIVIDGSPTVLSPHRMDIQGADGRWTSKPLQGEIRDHLAPEPPILLAVDGLLYIGHDFGEWGGGLQRLDPKTGAVSEVEPRDSEGRCIGHLCSIPITGLIRSEDAPGCLLVSTGLAHMVMQEGAIVRLCGDAVSTVLEKAWTEQFPGGPVRQSEPFYGLAKGVAGESWILGFGVLYRFDGSRAVAVQIPELAKLGDVWVSHAIPDHMMVYYSPVASEPLGKPMPFLITRE